MWTLSSLFENVGVVHEGLETVSQPLRLQDAPGAKALSLDGDHDRESGGEGAAIIGRAIPRATVPVVMKTLFGGGRIVDMLVTEQLPRIC